MIITPSPIPNRLVAADGSIIQAKTFQVTGWDLTAATGKPTDMGGPLITDVVGVFGTMFDDFGNVCGLMPGYSVSISNRFYYFLPAGLGAGYIQPQQTATETQSGYSSLTVVRCVFTIFYKV